MAKHQMKTTPCTRSHSSFHCHKRGSGNDQKVTDYLYGGDNHYRLCQEVVLGLGGIAMLSVLWCRTVQICYMKEATRPR